MALHQPPVVGEPPEEFQSRKRETSTLEANVNRKTGSLLAAILTIAAMPAAAQWLNVPTKPVLEARLAPKGAGGGFGVI